MVAYLASVWDCRYFWLSLVRNDLRSRYRGSILGIGWSLLQPIAMTTIICLVFGKMLGESVHEFAPYLMAGLACWNYLVTSALQGSHCFFQGESYIRQYPAPLAIYPLRTMLANAFHFLIALILVIFLAGLLLGYRHPWTLLSLVPTVLLLLPLGWSIATLFALMTVRFRDTHHLGEVAFQAMFYLTPIMYTPNMARQYGLGVLSQVNPVVPFLELLRDPLVNSTFPPLTTYAAASLIVLGLSSLAALVLWRGERRVIFYL